MSRARSRRSIVALAAALLALAASPARATFVGDLVYCDLNRNGLYEPGAGEPALNGVGVTVECRLPDQTVCFAANTTTGTIDPSAQGLTDFLQQICAPSLTWDPDGDITGRYLVEVFNACSPAGPGPWTCTVTVDQASAPPSCPDLVTPLAAGPPVNGNADGDFCDPQDGPFPEGQPLGNLPQAIGQNLQTCEQAPDPAPGNGTFTVIVSPVGGDDCALYNDFGFAPEPPTEGCTPGYWKQRQHLDSWAPTGLSPQQSVESVFDAPAFPALGAASLLNALQGGGGSGLTGAARILLRAAVAALLNASHPDVDYPRTSAQVVSAVNAALASGSRSTMLSLATRLDALNNLGCPLD
jgi:hypothetical protein